MRIKKIKITHIFIYFLICLFVFSLNSRVLADEPKLEGYYYHNAEEAVSTQYAECLKYTPSKNASGIFASTTRNDLILHYLQAEAYRKSSNYFNFNPDTLINTYNSKKSYSGHLPVLAWGTDIRTPDGNSVYNSTSVSMPGQICASGGVHDRITMAIN